MSLARAARTVTFEGVFRFYESVGYPTRTLAPAFYNAQTHNDNENRHALRGLHTLSRQGR
ncbi:hypothetical protein BN2476_230319 [Paraburkholderia piptadeniae]|uniref:Uncharacterized protein n=1 Tax=Paraburkholderia piptadeniae TaxID=1701573 RepID=A0A1N7RXV3_9BURK|nr:hypothetical protein BN2476_230319 [Paraburkholderia piptadeniae]